ncbi:single-stranded-DNA-specific exonuclease RecJ [Geobacter argillaceus]|uniref:Single-stranded-DNA-specific exonuclease RecJ n=1 Tax=Geobacter argillaceus TaxID=345631 RepID=A0A562WTH9_9BACT|nr:single-stranded-DNA-specific exonuclease RecJ [Geobacter argillaceus]TWJ32744.1 exonuclease RecJ [Geobacter argillaceus]
MHPVIERRWTLKNAGETVVGQLCRELGVGRSVATVLANRGYAEPAAAGSFLEPALAGLHDPFLLAGMSEAVDRLVTARKEREQVCIYGDYDVDGVSSTVLLMDFFRRVGIPCSYHIPHRMDEGYGLSRDGLVMVAKSGARVVVSVDCGITAVDEARWCAENGLDLIITDHHMPGPEIPSAVAVVNPLQPGCGAPFRQLAGVGLAFKLVVALRARLRAEGVYAGGGEPNLRQYLDLVALGTIADLVPLVGENRIIARYGLQELTNSHRVGITALKEVAGVNGQVTCGAVGFRLAPRLNAAGRLDDAARGVELLLTDDPIRARELAVELDAGNRERQELEQEILRDALALVREDAAMHGRRSIVLASPDWHPGVIGIVASRIVELYHRPTVLIALQDGNGKGSGRSIPAFHLRDALAACSDHLLKFGGHRQAAGLAIDESTLAAFVERFDEVAAGLLTPDDLMPELTLEGVLEPAEITTELVRELERLAPFGIGNSEPLFLVRGARVENRRELKGGHLRLTLSYGGYSLSAIAFNMSGHPATAETLDLVCSPQLNEWNGRTAVQLKIRDMKNP